MGSGFALGPGGKGSNQSVAAARLGSRVSFISRLGDDAFARMARDMWDKESIEPLVAFDPNSFTGAAYIFVDDSTGDNAIIVVPGAARDVGADDLNRNRQAIENASVFLTQLETPVEASIRGLEIANEAKVVTILNPAPAATFPDEALKLCDYLTPNESEAAHLVGRPVETVTDAEVAAMELRDRGANTIIVTLGKNGAFFYDGETSQLVPSFDAGPVVETTGAGDCFNGAFAHAIANGVEPLEATRFACAAASLSVTRPGTAPSMPTASEVAQLVQGGLT